MGPRPDVSTRRDLGSLLVAVLVSILAAIFVTIEVSASTTVGAETRVRASAEPAAVVVGPPERIAAGQRLGEAVPGVVPVVATGVAANGEDNVVNGTRLGQQLRRESADSVFTSSVRLSSGAIADSRQIIPGSRLGNEDLVQRLISDGSDIADRGKYTTRTHQSPSGDIQVHFYMNRSTGAIDYGYDYKTIIGAR